MFPQIPNIRAYNKPNYQCLSLHIRLLPHEKSSSSLFLYFHPLLSLSRTPTPHQEYLINTLFPKILNFASSDKVRYQVSYPHWCMKDEYLNTDYPFLPYKLPLLRTIIRMNDVKGWSGNAQTFLQWREGFDIKSQRWQWAVITIGYEEDCWRIKIIRVFYSLGGMYASQFWLAADADWRAYKVDIIITLNIS